MIGGLNKHFESRVRLGVMSVLMVEQWVPFKDLKERLDLTDGNLASHVNALMKHGYIVVHKDESAKRTKTSYSATPLGRSAFTQHLSALEKLLKGYES